MAKKKAEKICFQVDGTGWNLGEYAPTREEILAHGTGQDIRNVLRDIADRLTPIPIIDRDGRRGELPASGLDCVTRKWLVDAIERIASGEDANKVFRTKLRVNADYATLREKREIEYQFDSLRAQGASPEEAYDLIASWRLRGDPQESNRQLMHDKAVREAQKVKRIKSKKLK